MLPGMRTVHYSTGRLTPAEAATVDAWRARLLTDKPLPGREPRPRSLRLLGIDDRPRASLSDAVAAVTVSRMAVVLRSPLGLIRYAHQAGQLAADAAEAAREGWPPPDGSAVATPVSFYLPWHLAADYDAAQAAARDAWFEAYAAARATAEDAGTQGADARQVIAGEMRRRRLPARLPVIRRGTLARYAITAARWSPDEVCLLAEGHAAEHHEQIHRARRDSHCRTLRS
jgi:hypothetical protein